MHIEKLIHFSIAMLKALFTTTFSKANESSRTKEEESYIFFGDFLDSCEGSYLL